MLQKSITHSGEALSGNRANWQRQREGRPGPGRAGNLERAAVPQVEDIVAAARKLANYRI